MDESSASTSAVSEVTVDAATAALEGTLTVPEDASGVVLFAHGSGSSRHSPRNRFVAGELNKAGLATLLIDLLIAEEERVDVYTAEFRFDIGMLARRLVGAAAWLSGQSGIGKLEIGYFGSSTGAGAALVAAADSPDRIGAIVSRGGRPDLAGRDALSRVKAPTLLIVGGNDPKVIDMNRQAQLQLSAESELKIVPGATHLFEEPGTLEEVARLAAEWFSRYLGRPH